MDQYKILTEQLMAEGFEVRPYGGKKTACNGKILVIDKGKNTGMTDKTGVLNDLGLRGHPGIAHTIITHLGYFDGSGGDEESLLYKFLNPAGKAGEISWKKGDRFDSVGPEIGPDGLPIGYWNILINKSEKPIKILVQEEYVKPE